MPKARKNSKSEETKQASEPDSDVAEILELSGWGFKITINKDAKHANKKSR